MGARENDSKQYTAENTPALPEGAQWEGAQPGEGDPGMLGAKGTEPTPGIPTHTSPVGVPTEVGGVTSPGATVPPGVSTADTMKQADIYGVPGRMGHAYTGNTDPGVPGVGGTPVPGGPLRDDPTPPLMPDYGRVGEEGFEATLEGTDSGVATGSSPVTRRPRRGEAESSFNRYTGSPVVGVTSEDMAGQQTDRGVTDPEAPSRQFQREEYRREESPHEESPHEESPREESPRELGQEAADRGVAGRGRDGAPNPDARDVVVNAPEPGADM